MREKKSKKFLILALITLTLVTAVFSAAMFFKKSESGGNTSNKAADSITKIIELKDSLVSAKEESKLVEFYNKTQEISEALEAINADDLKSDEAKAKFNEVEDSFAKLKASGELAGLIAKLSSDDGISSEAIEELKKLVGVKPIFAICLGHQLLALSQGAKTEKLKYGHRGVNQPVKNLETGRTYISSQNHGYAVVNESVEEIGAKISYINANDGTVEGIDYDDKMAFSVQFHPEACSGPHDTRFIFDKFINMMGGKE